MTTATITGTDVRLRNAVLRELDWDPTIDNSAIGVTARDRVVTLTGFIDSCIGKLTAERIAKRVRGVRAVANEIAVRPVVARTDPDLAASAVRELGLRPEIPESVQVAVHRGHLTLTGKVEWPVQKDYAALAVEHIPGIRGIHNHIDVAPNTGLRDIRRHIVQALHGLADVDGRHIQVAVAGDAVTLSGTVGSWAQRDAAERGAGRAPGIRHVDNRLVVATRPWHESQEDDEIC